MFNMAHADYFQDIYIIETKLDFVSFNDKNLQRRRKFVGERDFPIQNSYTSQVPCLSHSRDQKFETSLLQSAIAGCPLLLWPYIRFGVVFVTEDSSKKWTLNGATPAMNMM